MFQDDVLRKLYVQFNEPADRIVGNPALMQSFMADYSAQSGHCAEQAELAQHLLNLRRRGEDKGGLPRLRRNFSGRRSVRTRIDF